jgi:hypothetical protein
MTVVVSTAYVRAPNRRRKPRKNLSTAFIRLR